LTIPNILIIAGEASGEMHAARMISALKLKLPEVAVSGIGGENMRAAGVEILVDFSELAVMGLVEVLKQYRQLKAVLKQMEQRLKEQRPDLLILVDYPGFNLRLAKKAKKLGIPVLYYISPKVWAWRAGRVKTIKRVVDYMAVLFPFEVPIYEKAGVPVSCVGHPLVDAVHQTMTVAQTKKKFGLKTDRRVLGLFPGSRRSEVNQLLPVMLEAAAKICNRHLDISVVLPLAPGLDREFLKPILTQSKLPVKVIEGDFYDLTASCDAIVAASGTVTLEIALLGVPHLIVYRVAPLTYKILRRLVKIPYVGLCNIVTGKPLVTELLQDDVTVEQLDDVLTGFLIDPNRKQKAGSLRQQVLAALGPSGGADNAANQVVRMLGMPTVK